MDLRTFIQLLRRSAVLIGVLLPVGLAGGLAVALIQPPQYEATATAYVSLRSAESAVDLVQGTTYVQQAAASYATVAKTSYILNVVITDLRLPTDADHLAKSITASNPPDTSILLITAKNSSPVTAAAVANGIMSELVRELPSLTATRAASAQVAITRLQNASPPDTATTPVLWLDLALGLLAGLVVAAVIIGLREGLNTRLRSPGEVEDAAGSRLLGTTVLDSAADRLGLAMLRDDVDAGEEYRRIRTGLEAADSHSPAKRWLVTSARAAEGKSTLAANLAIALARTGKRVVLVDADLRHPAIGRIFDLHGPLGLTDVVDGRAPLSSALQPVPTELLTVLTAGPLLGNPNELLSSAAAERVLDDLDMRFDHTIIDSPAQGDVSDAAALASRVTGVIVVAAIGEVRRSEFAGLLTDIERANGRLLGVVATKAARSSRRR